MGYGHQISFYLQWERYHYTAISLNREHYYIEGVNNANLTRLSSIP